MSLTWYPLPRSAQGIFFATELEPEGSSYITAELIMFETLLDAGLLRRAIRAVYAEHETLRTVIELGYRGQIQREVVWAALPAEEHSQRLQILEELSLEAAPGDEEATVLAWAQQRRQKPMPVCQGQGLDSALVQVNGQHWFYHSIHHLLADGFAAYEILRQIFSAYSQLEAGAVITFHKRPSLAELAEEDAHLQQELEIQRAAYLQKLPELAWGEDPSLDVAPGAGGPGVANDVVRVRVPLSSELQSTYRKIGDLARASWPHMMVAAVGAFLGRHQGVDSFRALVPQMNRLIPGLPPRLSAQTALSAVNLLPLVCPARGKARKALEAVQAGMKYNAEHALAPYEDLQARASQEGVLLGGAQINIVPFDAHFSAGSAGRGRVINVAAGPVPHMTVTVRGMPYRGHELSVEIDINADLLLAQDADALAQRLVHWLGKWAQIALDDGSMDSLSLLSPGDEVLLESLEGEHVDLDFKPLAAILEQKAQEIPHQVAFVEAPAYQQGSWNFQGERELTYAQLRNSSMSLALELASWGVDRGSRVGVRGHRSLEFMVVVFALTYLGAVYVPLEPSLPGSRVRSMCQDAELGLVVSSDYLSQLQLEDLSQEYGVKVMSFPEHLEDREAEGDLAALKGQTLGADELAYILFTSGSTGRPKGVGVKALALHNRLAWQSQLISLGQEDRVLHKTPISFDVHIWELYWGVTQGAKTVLCAPWGHRDPAYLARVIRSSAIDVLHFVPSMLAAFVRSKQAQELMQGWDGPRALVCSGEALDASLVRQTHQVMGAKIYNFYGPTEAAIDVTAYCLDLGQVPDLVPMGKPVWNTAVSIRDAAGQLCPPLMRGELYLHGVQVSDGYLNRPDMTAAAFSSDDFGQPVYATGDVVVWGKDNLLYYRGRLDHQIKIRGQRVELTEIETVLSEAPSLASSCLIYRQEGAKEYLLAFVEVAPGMGSEEAVDLARNHAARHLSDYMIPTHWQVLENLPLTVNGKIDRSQLMGYPLPEEEVGEVPPPSFTVERCCRVFSRVLGQEVGAATDFFSAGGHSLLAMVLAEELGQEFGCEVSVVSIFANPTPEGFAASMFQEYLDDFDPCLILRSGDGGAPVIFMPPAGGLGWCYAPLLSAVPESSPVFLIQAEEYSGASRGESSSLTEAAGRALERLLEMQNSNLRGATLVGWSLGGMMAQELACRLEARGLPPQKVLVLDAYPQSYWRTFPPAQEEDRWRAIARLGGLELQQEDLTEAGVTEALRLSGSALGSLPPERLQVCLKLVQKAMEWVRQGTPSPLEAPLVLLAAQQTLDAGAPGQAWKAYCSDYELVVAEGGHTDVLKAALIEQILQGPAN